MSMPKEKVTLLLRRDVQYIPRNMHTVFALLCFVVLIHWLISPYPSGISPYQSNDCPSASKATLMNMDSYFMWIHYERLHNHNKAKHNKTVYIFLGIYCTLPQHTILCHDIPFLARWYPIHVKLNYKCRDHVKHKSYWQVSSNTNFNGCIIGIWE